MKQYIVVIGGFLLLFAVLGILIYDRLYPISPTTKEIKQTKYIYSTRYAINNFIRQQIKVGMFDEIIALYSTRTRNSEISYELLTQALRQNIPVNLLFAMAEWESGYFPDKMVPNADRSYDIGVLMCNTFTFPNFTPEALKIPKLNIALGSEYLNRKYLESGSWEEAIIGYNAGHVKPTVKNHSIKHLVNVLNLERQIDDMFAKFVNAKERQNE